MASKLSCGDELECRISKDFHQGGIPILVSPALLRSCGCGQLDLVRLKGQIVEVFEVKSRGHISRNQLKRVRDACNFLGYVLDKVVIFKIVSPNICQRDQAFLSY